MENLGYLLRSLCLNPYKQRFFLKKIEVKIIGKNAGRSDRTSVITKLKSEDKICIHVYISI